ncbi:MAG: PQQ-dependent sugar dehydrogenase [Actinomycetota bacterium]
MRTRLLLPAALWLLTLGLPVRPAAGGPTPGPGAAHPTPPAARPAAGVRGTGITRHTVASGLDQPVTFAFTPKGRIFYGEKATGEIRIVNPATHSNRHFFTIPNVVGNGEQGLLGLAVDPDYPAKPFLFAYATRNAGGGEHDQILRMKNVDGHAEDVRVIFSSNTTAGQYHDGGRIEFGPDGFLYAVQGEAHDSSNAQDLTNAAGKILRMTRTGAAAPGNPFAAPRYARIWSYGHRNAFGFDFDPRTGRLWESENGPACNDEINRIVRGGNFGWGPNENCSSGSAPQNTNNSGPAPRIPPKRWYTPTIAPTGLVFCRRCGLGDASLGRMFFGAYNTGQIRRVTLTPDRLGIGSQTVVYTNADGIYSMEAGPGGALYFSAGNGIFKLVRP